MSSLDILGVGLIVILVAAIVVALRSRTRRAQRIQRLHRMGLIVAVEDAPSSGQALLFDLGYGREVWIVPQGENMDTIERGYDHENEVFANGIRIMPVPKESELERRYGAVKFGRMDFRH